MLFNVKATVSDTTLCCQANTEVNISMYSLRLELNKRQLNNLRKYCTFALSYIALLSISRSLLMPLLPPPLPLPLL